MNLIINLLAAVLAVAFTVTLHGYITALASNRLGDPRPKDEDRLNLNPLKHSDPLGFIFLVVFNFGWCKPVETYPLYYSNRKRDTIIVHLLPIVCNLLFGILFGMAYRLLNDVYIVNGTLHIALNVLSLLCYYLAVYNVSFGLFNIIPVHPLSAERILQLFLPPRYVVIMQQYRSLFAFLLLVFIFGGLASRFFSPLVSLIIGFNVNLGGVLWM